jgi:hypothetical protein
VAADVEPSSEESAFLEHLPLIESVIAFVVRRHRLSVQDGEDFASVVKLKLIANDYAVFRTFQNRSSMRTYLTVVVQREFVDFQRARWGKWTPGRARTVRGARRLFLRGGQCVAREQTRRHADRP